MTLVEGSVRFASNGQPSKNAWFSSCFVDSSFFTYPLKMFFPEYMSDSPCRWVYLLTYGGGLVAGDSYKVTYCVNPDCGVLVTTQSATKVFTSALTKPTSQEFTYKLSSNCLLAALPDPLILFQHARLQQKQEFFLENSSNLILTDWFLAGRLDRGEKWEFDGFENSLKISIGKKVIMRDHQKMENFENLPLMSAFGKVIGFGLCVLIGPQLIELSKQITQKWQKKVMNCRSETDPVVSASPLYINRLTDRDICGCVLRFACHNSEQGYSLLSETLSSLFPVLGGNPFELK